MERFSHWCIVVAGVLLLLPSVARAQLGDNLALGMPTEQSSQLGAFDPDRAVDDNLDNFTHTQAGADLPGPAWWQVDLQDSLEIGYVVIWNRTSCCGSRLRDIIVQIIDFDGFTVLWETTSPDAPDPDDLLNPENVDGVFPLGPASIAVDIEALEGEPVEGRFVRVLRIPDEDLSGTAGQGNADESTVLSLGEVQVFESAPVCPEEGDTHCDGIIVNGPLDGAVGLYDVSALGFDDSADPIRYSFRAEHEGGTVLAQGPFDFDVATFDIQLSGEWTFSVTVDDSAVCEDVADDATCSEIVEVEGLSAMTDAVGMLATQAFLVLGPFSHSHGCGGDPALLEGNHLAPDHIGCLYPEEGDEIDYDPFDPEVASTGYLGPVSGAGAPFWRAFDDGTPFNGNQDLNGDSPGAMEDVVSWLVTYVEYKGDEPTTVSVCFGSDDGGQVWFNDRLVWTNNVCRGLTDCADTFEVVVEPGVVRIAAAAWNRGGGWALSLGLSDELLEPIVDDGSNPDWVFLGPEPPASGLPECTIVDPVTITTCERDEEGGVTLVWENPPEVVDEIRILANGVEIADVGGDETEFGILAESLPAEDPIRICVDNGALPPACCTITRNAALGGIADQSSQAADYSADRALNEITTDFTHTVAGNLGLGPAIWEVDLGREVPIDAVVLLNRTDCCQSRLRDIVVSVHDISFREDLALDPLIQESADADFPLWEDALFETELLNPEDELLGPPEIEVDLVGEEVSGRYVRVTRLPDVDLSGTAGVGNNDEGTVLSLAEVQVLEGSGGPIDPPGPRFVRGDADANSRLNITDGIYILNYLFLGGPDPDCLDAADADDNGSLNITDGIYVLNFLFLGGPDPAAPHEECGEDPVEEDPDLGCLAFPPCEG